MASQLPLPNRVYLDLHDEGSIVPVLSGVEPSLKSHLQKEGCELLDRGDAETMVYTQLYTEEEQLERDAGHGFHRGYSIRTFFERFEDLRKLLDRGSVEQYADFLDAETLAVLRPRCPTGTRRSPSPQPEKSRSRSPKPVLEERIASLQQDLDAERNGRRAAEEQKQAMQNQFEELRRMTEQAQMGRTQAQERVASLQQDLNVERDGRKAAEEQKQAVQNRLEELRHTSSHQQAQERVASLQQDLIVERNGRKAAEEEKQALQKQIKNLCGSSKDRAEQDEKRPGERHPGEQLTAAVPAGSVNIRKDTTRVGDSIWADYRVSMAAFGGLLGLLLLIFIIALAAFHKDVMRGDTEL